ncbi:MAG: hypothetical protein AB7F65_05555 [Dehalococcoidia bacterium]
MPKYAITRTWSLAGWVTTEIEAESEEEAQRLETRRWNASGVLASLPRELKQHIEEIEEHVEDVRVLPA